MLSSVGRLGSQSRKHHVKYRVALSVLVALLAFESIWLVTGIGDPCGIELGDWWPWSTATVLILGSACWVLTRQLSVRDRAGLLLLVIGIVSVDLGQARYRSRLGSLVLGGVESLVQSASSASSDREALACLNVAATATDYGPDVARTFVLNHFDNAKSHVCFV